MELTKKQLSKLFDVLFKASIKAPDDAELSELLMKTLEELQKK